jgi:hypothetical protein
MEFPEGVTVQRDRRRTIADPYNPAVPRLGRWDEPLDTITIEQAFVASSSSSSLRNATREQILTAKSLYVSDPDADIRAKDRIRVGGETYYVHAKPSGDTNPFTGWRPALEIPLEENDG